MLNIKRNRLFVKKIAKIKDSAIKNKVKGQIEKILNNPEIGKPMRYGRKGTREVYVSPYRFAYSYDRNTNTITFLDIYHKDEQ